MKINASLLSCRFLSVWPLCVAFGLLLSLSARAVVVPGLKGGFVDSTTATTWLTVTPEATQAYPGPHAATNRVASTASTGFFPPIWGKGRTWVYTGQMFLGKGTHWFFKYLQDYGYLAINGTQYLKSTSYNAKTRSSSYTVTADEGEWVDIEIRLFKGTGAAAGPYAATTLDANGVLCGFGHAVSASAPATDMANFTYPCDPGDGSVFRHEDGRGAADTLEVDCEPVRLRAGIQPSYSLLNESSAITGLSAGDAVSASAPASVSFGDHLVATCTGWRLSYWSDAAGDYVFDASAPNAQGTSNAFTYVHQGVAARLDWQWRFAHDIAAATATLYVTPGGSGLKNGSSWDNAFGTVAEAVAAADSTATNVIVVGPGIYWNTADSDVSKPVVLLGIDQRDGTKTTFFGNSVYRTLYLNHAGAVADNFRLYLGRAGSSSSPQYGGGGLRISSAGGLAKNLLIQDCFSGNEKPGGSVYLLGGTLSRSTITGGYTVNGNGNGSGAYIDGGGAVVEHCLFYGNSQKGRQGETTKTGAVYLNKGLVRNCTIVKNCMGKAGGIYVAKNGVFIDSIVYGNETMNDTTAGAPNWQMADGACVTNICSPVAMGVTTPTSLSLAASPCFKDFDGGDYTLSPGSPCIDTASAAASTSFDLAGEARVQGAAMDIGAYESDPSVPAAGFSYEVEGAMDTATLRLAAILQGIDPSSASVYWSYDGRLPTAQDHDAAGASVTATVHAGSYSVCLAVYAGGEVHTALQPDLFKIFGSRFYVREGNNGAAMPHSTWATAAADLPTVLALSTDGTEIIVTNGTYTVTAQLDIFDDISIRSVEGPSATTIKASSCRALWINAPGALVSGFTISGGTAAGGGGARLVSGTISNCVVKGCSSGGNTAGGGVYMTGGLLVDCTLTDNRTTDDVGNGFGVYASGSGALIDRCVVTNNYNKRETRPTGAVALADGAVCRNSLIARNQSPKTGGVLVENGRLENCTVVSNYTNKALGAAGGIHCSSSKALVANCIAYGNYSSAETLAGAMNNVGGTASCFMTNAIPVAFGTGTVTADPQFKNFAGGNYMPRGTSPCRDAGDRGAYTGAAADLDLAHTPRIKGRRPDLGCYEIPFQSMTTLFIQ